MTEYTPEAVLFGARLVHPDKECFIEASGKGICVKHEFPQTDARLGGYIVGYFNPIINNSDWVALREALDKIGRGVIYDQQEEVYYIVQPFTEALIKATRFRDIKHKNPRIAALMACEVLKDET